MTCESPENSRDEDPRGDSLASRPPEVYFHALDERVHTFRLKRTMFQTYYVHFIYLFFKYYKPHKNCNVIAINLPNRQQHKRILFGIFIKNLIRKKLRQKNSSDRRIQKRDLKKLRLVLSFHFYLSIEIYKKQLLVVTIQLDKNKALWCYCQKYLQFIYVFSIK